MSHTTTHCRACLSHGPHMTVQVREMLHGTRESFTYFECRNCGCIQIEHIPQDMSPYYPKDYYSYCGDKPKSTSSFQRRLRAARSRAWLGSTSSIGGRLLATLSKRPPYFKWLTRLAVDLDARILDVGCGAGNLLRKLQRDGFSRLQGIDPFIAADLDLGNGLCVYKRSLEEETSTHDVIMLHHAFEHVIDPRAMLTTIRNRLAPDGVVLLRLPIAGCYAWRKYRENWYSLDAPRHTHIPSVQTMTILAAAAGLRIDQIFYDAGASQFLVSELYQRNISSNEASSRNIRLFDNAQEASMRQFSNQLNDICDGDNAGFVLRHA